MKLNDASKVNDARSQQGAHVRSISTGPQNEEKSSHSEVIDLERQVSRIAAENTRLESDIAACHREVDKAREEARTARLREVEAKQNVDRAHEV